MQTTSLVHQFLTECEYRGLAKNDELAIRMGPQSVGCGLPRTTLQRVRSLAGDR